MSNKIWVVSREICVRDYREPVQFGEWESQYQFEVENVYSHDSFGGEEFTVGFDVGAGDVVHAVVLIYGSGDSFGQSSGNGEIIWLFKDPEKAKEVVELVEAAEDYSLEFEDESGNKIKITNPAFGFFESVEDAYIKSMVVM